METASKRPNPILVRHGVGVLLLSSNSFIIAVRVEQMRAEVDLEFLVRFKHMDCSIKKRMITISSVKAQPSFDPLI